VEACVKTHLSKSYENDVVNIGSDVEMTILQLAQAVIKATQSTSRIEFLPPLPEGDMSRRCPDISKMRHLLDRPLVPLEEGIARLVEHYRQQDPRLAQSANAGTGG
jgi:nucleoside-diphosphate-sugar epimerase